MKRYILAFLGLMILFAPVAALAAGDKGAAAATGADAVVGLWVTQNREAVVEIYACDENEYCGRFYWLEGDSAESPSRDNRNPDPSLRQQNLCGMTFLGGFEWISGSDYGNGWVYSPRHGAKFSASLKMLDPDRLEMRGYMFLPFLGSSEVWRRQEHSLACPTLANAISP